MLAHKCYYKSVLNDTKGENDMDKALLEYHIKHNEKTVHEFCAEIGMSRSAFYRKCTGLSEFTRAEIATIIDHLGIDTPDEMNRIFFAKKCPKGHEEAS